MTVVVVAEAALLVVLGFFAVGLLHSYAGLLRRVQRLEGDVPVALPRTRSPLPVPSGAEAAGVDIAAELLDGGAVTLAVTGVEHNTLLAFLSSGCSTCAGFWAGLPGAAQRTGGGGTRLVVVTQGPEHESPSTLASLASPELVDTVMSTSCWQDYAVPGSPYFVFVDGPTGVVRGEGTALGWDGVFDLIALAEGDSMLGPASGARPRKPASDAAREAAVDQELLRAGIRPGHPSLYPVGPGEATEGHGGDG